MSDSYDDYEAKIQLAEYAWEKRVDKMVKTEHKKQIDIAQAYQRGWNAALAQREWVGLTDDVVFELADTNLYEGGKNFGVLAFAKAIEQALKEKNT